MRKLCRDLNNITIHAASNGQYIRPTGKQEAHGPHRSPEKTVQINYIITLIKKEEKIITL